MKIKRYIKIFVLFFLIFGNICVFYQPYSMEDLLLKTNYEHSRIEKRYVDKNTSIALEKRLFPDKKIQYWDDRMFGEQQIPYHINQYKNYAPEKKLTIKQLQEDIDYLFNAFYDCYGAYEYFGGDEKFSIAKNEILTEIQKKQIKTAEELEKVLIKHLNFIKDAHFKINGKYTNLIQIPFFFREVDFQKTECGYQTKSGKQVESVEGYKNLDELFRLSISSEGELVYYPILLKENDFYDSLEIPQICNETLIIHYTNGEIQKLEAEPYQIYISDKWIGERKPVFIDESQFYPVLQINSFDKNCISSIFGAVTLKKNKVSILDLRSNSGGYNMGKEWISKYAGEDVEGNGYLLNPFKKDITEKNKDKYVDNNNLLIILVGKYTASASEVLLDCAYNLENVLIVGENTFGAILGDSSEICLPNSLCHIDIGTGTLYLTPENEYFKEFRGFFPDIWVPSKEAEELIFKFMYKQ